MAFQQLIVFGSVQANNKLIRETNFSVIIMKSGSFSFFVGQVINSRLLKCNSILIT